MRVFRALAFAAVFSASALAQDLLDLNTATREQLEALPGVGAKTASDIIREREENGPYGSVDDLNRVPSMTPSMLTKLRGLVKAGAQEQLVVNDGRVVGNETVRKVLKRYDRALVLYDRPSVIKGFAVIGGLVTFFLGALIFFMS